jgi:hypothetical protein
MRPGGAILQSRQAFATISVDHFRTVRGQTVRQVESGQTPKAVSEAAGAIRSRPRCVSRAFLCTFMRSSRESLKPRNSSFLGQDRWTT